MGLIIRTSLDYSSYQIRYLYEIIVRYKYLISAGFLPFLLTLRTKWDRGLIRWPKKKKVGQKFVLLSTLLDISMGMHSPYMSVSEKRQLIHSIVIYHEDCHGTKRTLLPGISHLYTPIAPNTLPKHSLSAPELGLYTETGQYEPVWMVLLSMCHLGHR